MGMFLWMCACICAVFGVAGYVILGIKAHGESDEVAIKYGVVAGLIVAMFAFGFTSCIIWVPLK